MDIVLSIGKYLTEEDFRGDVINHQDSTSLLQTAIHANIDPACIARSLLLSDEDGLLLVTFPASHCINLQILNEQLQRKCVLANSSSCETLFLNASPEYLPPFSPFAKLESVVDSALTEHETIYFPIGVNNKLIKMKTESFFSLQDTARYGIGFSHPLPLNDENNSTDFELPDLLQQRLTAMDVLPSIPETTRELLKLRNRPHSRVRDLSRIIELDPLLAAQLMCIASSALYAVRGDIKTLNEAITRVLGFDTAFNIALGLSTTDTFKGPKQGAVGQQRLFRDAVFCAKLCETLAMQMPATHQPETGTAQLAGLLHNIGYSLLGHIFIDDYKKLNKTLSARPNISIWHGFEQQFSTSPAHIGGWLMRLWDMPKYLDSALLEQRNMNSSNAVHAQLILLSNRLLHRYGIGDADSDELPLYILKNLGITASSALQIVEELMQHNEDLDDLARRMVA